MTRWIGLLRGINVGGTRKVPMADLRTLCGELGFGHPQTHIASGNVMFDADGDAETVARRLEAAMPARFGFACDIILRSAAEWRAHLASNPFAGDADVVPKMLHIALPRRPLKAGACEAVAARLLPTERVREALGALWIDYGSGGVANTKLSPAFLDKAAGSTVTGRNLNTAETLDRLLNGEA